MKQDRQLGKSLNMRISLSEIHKKKTHFIIHSRDGNTAYSLIKNINSGGF